MDPEAGTGDVRLERLSTGLRINRGGDDPSGLIAMPDHVNVFLGTKRNLRRRLAARGDIRRWVAKFARSNS